MRFYFIRHAQSSNNALYAATESEQGRSEDPELTVLGVQQAESLAQFLANHNDPLEPGGVGFTHLYASPMVRAMHTGSIVAKVLGLKLEVLEDWFETGGIWLANEDGERVGQSGKTPQVLQSRFPDVQLPALNLQGWWSRPHEQDCSVRAERAWAALLERHQSSDDRVALVSHGHFLAHVFGQVLGAKVNSNGGGVWFETHNTAVTRIDFVRAYQSLSLRYLNRLAHLEPGLVTY